MKVVSMKLRENQIYHEFISRSWYYIQLLRSVNFTTEHLPEQEGSVKNSWKTGLKRWTAFKQWVLWTPFVISSRWFFADQTFLTVREKFLLLVWQQRTERADRRSDSLTGGCGLDWVLTTAALSTPWPSPGSSSWSESCSQSIPRILTSLARHDLLQRLQDNKPRPMADVGRILNSIVI